MLVHDVLIDCMIHDVLMDVWQKNGFQKVSLRYAVSNSCFNYIISHSNILESSLSFVFQQTRNCKTYFSVYSCNLHMVVQTSAQHHIWTQNRNNEQKVTNISWCFLLFFSPFTCRLNICNLNVTSVFCKEMSGSFNTTPLIATGIYLGLKIANQTSSTVNGFKKPSQNGLLRNSL